MGDVTRAVNMWFLTISDQYMLGMLQQFCQLDKHYDRLVNKSGKRYTF